MITQKPQLRRNAEGFYRGGQFFPIRKGKDYDPALAGDYDFPAERDERRAANRKKAEKKYQQQLENEIRREMYGDAGSEKAGKTLMQFVRASGGIKRTYMHGKAIDAGELDGLTFKQSKKRGLVNDKSRYSIDKMFQNARQAGYDVRDENDLLNKLDDEIRKGKATYQTHGYLDYRNNPAKKVMQGKLSAAQIKSTAANIAKLYPNQNAKSVMAKLRRKNPESLDAAIVFDADNDGDIDTFDASEPPVMVAIETGEIGEVLTATENGDFLIQFENHIDIYPPEDLTVLEPELVENGAFSRWGKRYKAGRAFKKELRLKSAAARASEARQIAEAAAMRENPRRRSAAQPALDFAYQGFIPAIKIDEKDLSQPKYQNLNYEGSEENDFYYRDPVTGIRYFIRQNPARVKKVGTKYQIVLPRNQVLKDGSGRVWETRSKKQAMQTAAKVKIDGRAEESWLSSLRRQNPMHPLSMLANLGVGAVSAVQLHDRFTPKKKPRQNPTPKRASKKVLMTVGELTEFLTQKKGQHEVWKNSDSHLVAKKSPRFSVGQSKNHDDKVVVKLKNFRQNPAAKPAVKKNPVSIPRRPAFEMFQGRPATSMRPMLKSKHAPNKLDSLGKLVEIQLTDGRVLSFARTRNGRQHFPYELTMNGRATRLWIAGGKIARRNPSLNESQIDLIAPIEHVVYETYKPHIEGDEVVRHYIHLLGEESGIKPYLGADNEGYPVIHGGAYRIEDRGIVD